MQFRITFSEIEGLIRSKTGKELPLLYGGPHTIRISYHVPLMGAVGIDVNVERITGSDIYLSYSGGKPVEMMLRTAFSHFKNQPGADMLHLLDGNQILFALGKNPRTAMLFEHIILQDIHFDEHAVIVDFVPKG